MHGLVMRETPRVRATGPKKRKLQAIMERHGSHYAKHLKQDLEAYNNKLASIQMRKDILDKQNKANYQNEYENIRGILSHSSLPFQTIRRLRQRKEHLEDLGAQAFSIG